MMYDWKWNLADLKQDKDVTVFSTFSCGGGSSMGYKRAGLKVIGNCEIDKKINDMYVKNHHPKYNYCMDLREFNQLKEYPEELLNLDILDGSPPCSTFSMAGSREKAWNKAKQFREGQKLQTLDDLFFIFLDTVRVLKPKIVVAENVTGLVKGNAKGYVNEIIKGFRELGYSVQMFVLNGAKMEVPQARERVFFIANRMNYPKLTLNFNYPEIKFCEIRTEEFVPLTQFETKYWLYVRKSDTSFADVDKRLTGKGSYFGQLIVWDNRVCPTITSGGGFVKADMASQFSDGDFINAQSFPQDYDFNGNSVQYVCGMSVPPNMMAHVANNIYEQWLKK